MQEAHEDIEALGAGIIAVSGAADYQAQWLHDEKGIAFPLLLDPERALPDALGFQPMKPWRYLLPTTWRNYLAGWRRARQGAITGAPTNVPGLVIVDGDGILRFRHEGVTLGDYPPIDEVMAALRAI